MKKYFLPVISLLFALFMSACSNKSSEPTTTTITLSVTQATLKPSEVLIIESVVTPASQSDMIWVSSDETIATVANGVVTAKKEGEAVITATIDNASAQCSITVALSEYQLVWEEEFEGTALDESVWNYEIGTGSWGWGNNEQQYYTSRSENIRVQNGNLEIQALKESYEGSEYTSARITTANNKDFTYGKIEANIKLPSGGGTWPAFWMLGYGSWPYCGEIDIMEHVGNNSGMISHALHTSEKNGNRGNNYSWTIYNGPYEGDYHVYGIIWEEAILNGRDMISFTIDGEVTATLYDPVDEVNKTKWPFMDSFYIILNMALGGNMGGTIDDTIFESDIIMYVDWVRVYQRL